MAADWKSARQKPVQFLGHKRAGLANAALLHLPMQEKPLLSVTEHLGRGRWELEERPGASLLQRGQVAAVPPRRQKRNGQGSRHHRDGLLLIPPFPALKNCRGPGKVVKPTSPWLLHSVAWQMMLGRGRRQPSLAMSGHRFLWLWPWKHPWRWLLPVCSIPISAPEQTTKPKERSDGCGC